VVFNAIDGLGQALFFVMSRITNPRQIGSYRTHMDTSHLSLYEWA